MLKMNLRWRDVILSHVLWCESYDIAASLAVHLAKGPRSAKKKEEMVEEKCDVTGPSPDIKFQAVKTQDTSDIDIDMSEDEPITECTL